MEFQALTTFESPAFHSTYVEGLRYRIPAADSWLAAAVEEWVRVGLAAYVDAPRAAIAGIGQVN